MVRPGVLSKSVVMGKDSGKWRDTLRGAGISVRGNSSVHIPYRQRRNLGTFLRLSVHALQANRYGSGGGNAHRRMTRVFLPRSTSGVSVPTLILFLHEHHTNCKESMRSSSYRVAC